jgi:hypothetical protein
LGLGCPVMYECQSPGNDYNCTQAAYLTACVWFQFDIDEDTGECCLPAAAGTTAGSEVCMACPAGATIPVNPPEL